VNVTLRPCGPPDVYLGPSSGQCCNLTELDREIRALQVAREWLAKELALRPVQVKK
jgi:hypothetical protein